MAEMLMKAVKTVASSVKTVTNSVVVNLQTPGAEYVPLPLHGGLLGLGRTILLPPNSNTEILLVAVHGLIESTSVEISNEMLTRAKEQFRAVSPDFTIYERSIGSDGEVNERVDHCFDVINQENSLLRRVNMVFFIAHSQGCVVSMLTLARLLETEKLKGKQFGLIAFAGIHQGSMESYASMSIMRGATRELYYMSDPSYELSQAYRTAVAVVVGCGGRVMAFHSYDDNVVPCASSTLFDILPTHQNLAVGLYIPHYSARQWHFGDVADGSRPDLMMALIALWLKARNCGHRWDSRWGRVLRETTSYSEGLGSKVTNAIGNYMSTRDINVTINMSHCEIYLCSLLYLYGVYWMLQPTVQTVTSIATTAKTNADFPNLDDFVVSELKAACKSVGDLIATDIENWLDAFTEFRSSKGAYFKDFTAHWQHMQSKWAVSN